MRLKDKRFWILEGMLATIPFIMGLFAIIVLISGNMSFEFSELLYPANIEIFVIWEITYLLAGVLSYRKVKSSSWVARSFIGWGIACPLIAVSTFIWAGIRIHDGFSGLAYLMISIISWGGSILPLLLANYILLSLFSYKS